MSRSLLGRAALALVLTTVAACSHSNQAGTAQPPASPRTATAALGGASRVLPPDFFGVNGANFIRGMDPADPRFLSSLAALAPESIRVFGGTTANYWDWRTGSLVKSGPLPRDLGSLPPAGMTLEKWGGLVSRAGASPIFDLNIVTSTLSDQLDMLRAAQGMGLPIRRVELGNELYQNTPAVASRFPSPQAYAAAAATWTTALTSAFPGVQVSVVGALAHQGATSTARKSNWNAAIRATPGAGNAMTLHLYFDSGAGSAAKIDSAVASQVIATTAQRLRQFHDQDLPGVPAGDMCWVSEFNIQDRSSLVPGTWLHGLVVAQISIALASEPRVGMAVMHALVGNPSFAAIFGSGAQSATATSAGTGRYGQPFALTAAGQAMALVYAASRNASRAQYLTFGPVANLVGIAFTAGSTRQLLIANLSPAATTVQLGNLVAGSYRVSQLSADPSVFVSGPGVLQRAAGQATGPLTLRPWSIAMVG